MKDFLKWLGVNEKVARIAVWFLIFMVFVIVINTMLESIGLPCYMITAKNIVSIKPIRIIDFTFSIVVSIFTFYSMVLLVFRIKESKKIIKYALVYIILLIVINQLTNYVVAQIFIFAYILIFCYIYSNKNWKYVLYGIGSIAVNTITQYMCYLYKVRFIDYSSLNQTTKTLLGLDYFIIIGLIILVKEIYLKKRRN